MEKEINFKFQVFDSLKENFSIVKKISFELPIEKIQDLSAISDKEDFYESIGDRLKNDFIQFLKKYNSNGND